MQGRLSNTIKYGKNLFPEKWKEEFNKVRKLKISYIELILDRKLNNHNILVNQKINEIKKFNKIIYSYNLDYFTENNIFKKENLYILIKTINFIKKINKGIIIVPCIEKNNLNTKNLITLINILRDLIKGSNIKISIEINKINKLIEKKLNKNIGVCYDVGNLKYKSLFFLKKYYKFINHVHVKDLKFNKGKKCFLGSGDVELREIFTFLKQKKYKKKITLETYYNKYKAISGAKKNINFVNNLIN